MHDPWLRGQKIAYGFYALCCIVLAVTGLATLPQPWRRADELATRLEAASNYTSSLLAVSDGLLGSAGKVEPLMGSLNNTELGVLQAPVELRMSIQGASGLLDGLSRMDKLRSQLASARSILVDVLSPAVTNMAARISAALGTEPSLARVESMVGLLSTINRTLDAYDSALAAFLATMQMIPSSDPRVATLQAVQRDLNISSWLGSLDQLGSSLVAVDAATRGRRFPALADVLQPLQAAVAAAQAPIDTALVSLDALDSLYLGDAEHLQQWQQPPPLQPSSGFMEGRVAMLFTAGRLTSYEASVFRFRSALERSIIDTTLTVMVSLERMYGVDAASTASAVASAAALNAAARAVLEAALNGTSGTPGGVQMPLPLAAPLRDGSWVLPPLAAVNATFIAAQSGAVHSQLLDPVTNASVISNLTAILSYVNAVRSALKDLQQPADNVQQTLDKYDVEPNLSYNTLRSRATDARPVLAAAKAAAAAKLPPDAPVVAACAAGALRAANSTAMGGVPSLYTQIRVLQGHLDGVTNTLLNDNDGALASLDRTSSGLDVAQPALSRAQTQLAESGWGSNGSAAELGGSFLEPLLASLQLIADTLSSGTAAVASKLVEALSKPQGPSLPSSVPPPVPPPAASAPPPLPVPPSPVRRRSLLQSPPSNTTTNNSTTSSPGIANVTTVIRQDIVRRLDGFNGTLRGTRVQTYASLSYWVVVTVYIALVLLSLLLAAAVLKNFPAGLVFGLMAYLLLAAAMLVGAWAAAAGLVFLHDVCGSVESLALDAISAGSPLLPLARYYLKDSGGSLPVVLRTAGLSDPTGLTSAADTLQRDVLSPLLNSSAPGPGSLGAVQPGLGSILVALGGLAVDVTGYAAALLALGDRSAVLGQYRSVTGWGCCGLGEQLLLVWVCATGTGILAWLAALSAMLVLKNLDDMPIRSRCGCSCYDPEDFPHPVRRHRYSTNSSFDGGLGGGGGMRGSGAVSQAQGKLGQLPPLSPASRQFSSLARSSQSLHRGGQGGDALRLSQGGASSRGGGGGGGEGALELMKSQAACGKASSQCAMVFDCPLFEAPAVPGGAGGGGGSGGGACSDGNEAGSPRASPRTPRRPAGSARDRHYDNLQ